MWMVLRVPKGKKNGLYFDFAVLCGSADSVETTERSFFVRFGKKTLPSVPSSRVEMRIGWCFRHQQFFSWEDVSLLCLWHVLRCSFLDVFRSCV